MFDIALAVSSCLRAGTRADVAWVVESEGLPVYDLSDAVVFTPGGGKTGTLAGGVLDGKLADLAGRGDSGRLVDVEVSEVDAMVAGLSAPGSARCILVPADRLPDGLWELAAARDPFCVESSLDGDEIVDFRLFSADTIQRAGEEVERLFSAGERSADLAPVRLLCVETIADRVPPPATTRPRDRVSAPGGAAMDPGPAGRPPSGTR